jgi:hypothetical protein
LAHRPHDGPGAPVLESPIGNPQSPIAAPGRADWLCFSGTPIFGPKTDEIGFVSRGVHTARAPAVRVIASPQIINNQ